MIENILILTFFVGAIAFLGGLTALLATLFAKQARADQIADRVFQIHRSHR